MPLPEGVTNKSAEMVQIFTPRLDNADTVSLGIYRHVC